MITPWPYAKTTKDALAQVEAIGKRMNAMRVDRRIVLGERARHVRS
jgi:hypothetical protein